MRRLLWLQLLLVSLSSQKINGDETPKDFTTIKPTPAASHPDEMSAHVDSTKPKTEDHDQTASALLVPLAVDGTTKAPVPFLDIESADPLPVTSKKRSSDSHTTSADGQSVEKVEPKEVIDDSKLNENSELIDIARVSRQPETSTTPQPQPTTVNASIPKKRQSQMESSESTENEFLPVNVINGVNDASANAYFTGDPKRRVSLSHDEFSQMLSEVLKQNPIYGNTQDNLKSLPSYLRPLQVEKLPDGDKDPESYLDDGRQTGFQLEDQRNNDSPIYISVPLNKDFQQNKQNKPRPQQQFPQVFQDKDVVLTPTTKRPPIDPPTDTIQKQHEQQHQLQQQQQQQHEQQHQLQQQQQQQHKLQQLDQAIKDLQTFPILQPGASPPVSPSNPIIPAPLPFGPVLPANPNIPGQPPVDIVMHVNPSIPHEPPPPPNPLARPTSPSAAQPVSPAGHVHVLPPPTKVVPGPPSPKSSPSKNVTVPASCPTLVEFLNASRNVWNGIAEAGGLQAGLGIFFKAAGKVITTLTQCAKAILAEIGALFYQGVVEKMMGQLEEKPNSSSITTKNIKTADGRKQVEKNNQVKRNSVGNKKGRRYKKHVTPGAAGSSVNGDFIEAEIEEMDLEAEDEVTPDPGKVRGRKETENKAYDPFKESAQGNEDDSSGKKDNVEPGMY